MRLPDSIRELESVIRKQQPVSKVLHLPDKDAQSIVLAYRDSFSKAHALRMSTNEWVCRVGRGWSLPKDTYKNAVTIGFQKAMADADRFLADYQSYALTEKMEIIQRFDPVLNTVNFALAQHLFHLLKRELKGGSIGQVSFCQGAVTECRLPNESPERQAKLARDLLDGHDDDQNESVPPSHQSTIAFFREADRPYSEASSWFRSLLPEFENIYAAAPAVWKPFLRLHLGDCFCDNGKRSSGRFACLTFFQYVLRHTVLVEEKPSGWLSLSRFLERRGITPVPIILVVVACIGLLLPWLGRSNDIRPPAELHQQPIAVDPLPVCEPPTAVDQQQSPAPASGSVDVDDPGDKEKGADSQPQQSSSPPSKQPTPSVPAPQTYANVTAELRNSLRTKLADVVGPFEVTNVGGRRAYEEFDRWFEYEWSVARYIAHGHLFHPSPEPRRSFLRVAERAAATERITEYITAGRTLITRLATSTEEDLDGVRQVAVADFWVYLDLVCLMESRNVLFDKSWFRGNKRTRPLVVTSFSEPLCFDWCRYQRAFFSDNSSSASSHEAEFVRFQKLLKDTGFQAFGNTWLARLKRGYTTGHPCTLKLQGGSFQPDVLPTVEPSKALYLVLGTDVFSKYLNDR